MYVLNYFLQIYPTFIKLSWIIITFFFNFKILFFFKFTKLFNLFNSVEQVVSDYFLSTHNQLRNNNQKNSFKIITTLMESKPSEFFAIKMIYLSMGT